MNNALILISDGQKIRAVARSTGIPFSCSIKPPIILDPTATASGSSSLNFKKAFLSPFQFRGLPKASPPSKSGRAPRRRGKSMIATDTPNKNEIQMRKEKKRKQRKTLAKTKKRRVLQDSSSENEDDISVYSEEESILVDEEDDYAVVDPDCMPALQSLP
ncbi:hypothetical protein WA026_009235 [Henosepilachna vigintioctopunctata]|uniref:Uncharacterized protein n=1 Tax=Henosepilachna vigintioctopunctata TaxID=420089 RepID=A0AAW1UVZ8_9CUCU